MPARPSNSDNRRKRARRESDLTTRTKLDLLTAVLNTDNVLIILLDLEGRILMFNRASEILTGTGSEEAIGRHFWEISNEPDEAESVRDFFLNLLECDFPETHDRNWRKADNTECLLRWSLSKLQDGSNSEMLVAIGYDITELDRTEKQLADRTAQLTERVKELRCLYGIKRLGERQGINLDEFLQSVVEIIPPAWQFPEFTIAELFVGGNKYRSANYTESTICQQCPIIIDSRDEGYVRVCYTAGYPGNEDLPFLDEEERLLENIADAISRVVANYGSRQRIAEYQARLRSLASELALTGERERRKIAQQLHDDIGHNLALLKFRLGEQRSRLSGDNWEELSDLLETCILSSRTLTFELSPPVLHELGLGAALEWLSHQLTTNKGIVCHYEDDHKPIPLTDDLRVEVFQIVRELLNNVGKHSEASQASIKTSVDSQYLTVVVSDNGIGFDLEKQRNERKTPGWGLFSIRERLANSGGQFDVDSSRGHGTQLTVRLPLSAEAVPPFQSKLPVNQYTHPDQSDKKIRILLADDQQLARAGLRSLLERERDMVVVGEAGTGTQVARLAHELKPDVVVMDVVMPDLNGIEATRQIVDSDDEIKVIGLSMHSDGQYVLEMLRAGATGYLLKDCAQEDLAQAIRIVSANLTFLSPGLTDNMARQSVNDPAGDAEGRAAGLNEVPADVVAELTPREKEVLVLLAQGFTTKRIATELGVSVKTVETHRQHVMEKLGDNSIAGLTRFAIQQGLIKLH